MYNTLEHIYAMCENFICHGEFLNGRRQNKYTSQANLYYVFFMQTALGPSFGGGPLDSGKSGVWLAPTNFMLNSNPDIASGLLRMCSKSWRFWSFLRLNEGGHVNQCD